MPLGRTEQNQSGKNLVFLSPKVKENGKDVDPVFLVRSKVDGKYVDQKPETEFSGDLVKVEHKIASPPAPAQPFDLIALTVDDDENRYVVEFTFKYPTRSLFNRILNLENGKNVAFSYWRNADGFETLGIKQNGQPVKGKYTKFDPKEGARETDYPDVEILKSKAGKEIGKNYDEVNEFFKSKMIEFGAKLAPATNKPKEKVAANQESGYRDVSQEIDKEEIPF